MSRKLPLCQLYPSFNTPEIQDHTLRQSFSLGHFRPAGEKNYNIEFFFFIPVLYVVEYPTLQMPNSAITSIRVLCTVFGSHGEHTVPVLFAVFSPQLPRAGPFSCYIFSPPILTTVAESNSIMVFTDSFQLLQCLPITHEIKPKIYGLVFSALHNLMPTCLLLHSPLPSPQMCVCTHTCPYACAHTIHKGSFCFGQAISS